MAQIETILGIHVNLPNDLAKLQSEFVDLAGTRFQVEEVVIGIYEYDTDRDEYLRENFEEKIINLIRE